MTPAKTQLIVMQVQTGIQIIMDTQPKGGAAAGGTSREEAVDRIAEDLLAKARLLTLPCCAWHVLVEEPSAFGHCMDIRRGGGASLLHDSLTIREQLQPGSLIMPRAFRRAKDPCDLQFPNAVAPEEVAERLQKLSGGATAPLNVHLRQEVDRLNIVLRIARETLETLRLAIAGGCSTGRYLYLLLPSMS